MSSDFMDPLPTTQQHQQQATQVLHDTNQVIENASHNLDASSHSSHQVYPNNGEVQQNYYQGMDKRIKWKKFGIFLLFGKSI